VNDLATGEALVRVRPPARLPHARYLCDAAAGDGDGVADAVDLFSALTGHDFEHFVVLTRHQLVITLHSSGCSWSSLSDFVCAHLQG